MSSSDVHSSGAVRCPSPTCSDQEPVYLLHDIARSPFGDALNAARTLCGGVRGYPLLRNMKSRLQLPVLHCTGNIAKVVIHFVLACLPETIQEDARSPLLAITGKGKTDALYLREYRELVAHAAARPELFSRDLDSVFVQLLQLTQLLNASWRASLTDRDAGDRDGAASITRLIASIIGPLFQEIKPLDPKTKESKILTLYMHAPIAHLPHQVGAFRAAVAYISDEAIEGHLRGVGRYVYNHGNNASQAALLSDLAGLCDATIKFSTPRSHPSSLVFTKYVRVCKCWQTLGPRGPADFDALKTIGESEPHLTVESRQDGKELFFTLPLHERVDANKAKRYEPSGASRKGKKEFLRQGLRRRQGVITACVCGKINARRSIVTEVAKRRQAAKAAAQAALGASSGDDSQPGSCGEGQSDVVSDADQSATAARLRKVRSAAAGTTVRECLPPLWLLGMVFEESAVYATVLDSAPGGNVKPAPDVVDALLRKHITILRCFLLRTQTPQFARWAVNAKVDPGEMVEATETLIGRLTKMRLDDLPLMDTDVAMEI